MTTIEKAKEQNYIKRQILSILHKKGTCTLNRLVRLSNAKFNIPTEISHYHINILQELDVIQTEMQEGGDVWNTRYTTEVLTINKELQLKLI